MQSKDEKMWSFLFCFIFFFFLFFRLVWSLLALAVKRACLRVEMLDASESLMTYADVC
jgi:hypothetical protein